MNGVSRFAAALFFFLALGAGVVGGSGGSVTLEGSPTSYAQFHQWHGGPNCSVELEFFSRRPNGLILYTDNADSGEYLQLSLVRGQLRLRFNWGGGRSGMLIAGQRLNSDGEEWHQVALLRVGPETTMIVDRTFRASSAKTPKGASPSAVREASSFGDPITNSYVFAGGLPPWLFDTSASSSSSSSSTSSSSSSSSSSAKVNNLRRPVLPTSLLEPRFQGGIRQLRYRDSSHPTPSLQKMMAYKVQSTPVIMTHSAWIG